MKIYTLPTKFEFKQVFDTELGTPNSQILPAKGVVRLTVSPLRDHHAKITSTCAGTNTKYNIIGLAFLQNFFKIFDTELLCLILKYSPNKSTSLKQVPFSQISRTQPPYLSEIFNGRVRQYINVHGCNIKVIKLPL